ncbi:MAG: aminotransferase class V-fold PLP-dependent enzyme [Planctomycetaceae bacterium]|jgi:perosamine synthetase|nr:aminotransferase class V-fold PLP-dependent enzyme [Planctomycetaceae bacterium]MBT4013406.1 aminotransferase class V-fold PLP-dependent enzyme [Planctomycetaceae bacterium]MBT4726126.1 aminotransferase class V-fold PLP-dependent enzyme [Planctomycetaceae bacterium]MBT4845183.1 aminotransferase class V-fold PLP-dependent enzyme [Planctomycetaceae bacterium]MBT5599000.1 aminotransferase class V-fold PLP-dependent enzyme [Planctomycetaceae bacterium]
MWVRKRIDIGWADLASALAHCVFPNRVDTTVVNQCWRDSRHAFTCLSVRSGLDILLRALDLPRGSEVIVSAMTIDGILKIIAEHGLVAVPVDLQFETLAPAPEDVEFAITDQTRLVLIAHLFGTQIDMQPYARITQQHGLLLVEDCAQSFHGMPQGKSDVSDVAMYSFGPIKTATALGGAVLCIADGKLTKKMAQIQQAYPTQSTMAYFKRVVKYGFLKILSYRLPITAFIAVLRMLGKDYSEILKKSVKGFPTDKLFSRIRQQPCQALLSVLKRRITSFEERRLERHCELGELLCDHLSQRYDLPGSAAATNYFWVFPVETDNPSETIQYLRAYGFDADQRGSMVKVPTVPALQGEAVQSISTTDRILDNAVFLPIYPAMSQQAINQLAKVFCQVAIRRRYPEEDQSPTTDACAHNVPEILVRDI